MISVLLGKNLIQELWFMKLGEHNWGRLVPIASIAALAGSLAGPAVAATFGPATGYNVFTFGNYTQLGGDSWGPIAIGGNALFDSVGIADRTPLNPGVSNLVVGGNLSATNSQVYNGSATIGGSVSGNLSFNCAPACGVRSGNPIDFSAATRYYNALSSTLAALAPTGQSSLTSWGSLNLTGGTGTSVFTTSLAGVKELKLNTGDANLVVINVTDTTVSPENFGSMFYNDNGTPDNPQWSKVIWNFSNAETLNLSTWRGTVLAPKANLSVANGHIEGQVVTKSVSLTARSGEFHYIPFSGDLPGVTPQPPGPGPQPPGPGPQPPVREIPEPLGLLGLTLVGLGLKRRA
jgi:choice-of-anchor A domain-containing protein